MSDVKPKFLLVDDDPTFGQLLKTIAEAKGYSLTYVQSPKEAYEAIEKSHPNLDILEYDVGRVTVLQLSHYVERVAGKVPIMLVSAVKITKETRWPEPVTKFISKSVPPEILFSEIEKIFEEYLEKDVA